MKQNNRRGCSCFLSNTKSHSTDSLSCYSMSPESHLVSMESRTCTLPQKNVSDKDESNNVSHSPLFVPPVIFAGLSSPFSPKIQHRHEHRKCSHVQEIEEDYLNTIYSLEDQQQSLKSCPIPPVNINDLKIIHNKNETLTDIHLMKPSLSEQDLSMVLTTATDSDNDVSYLTHHFSTSQETVDLSDVHLNIKNNIQTNQLSSSEQKTAAELKTQIAELEAALQHSKARESLFIQSVETLRDDLAEKEKRLEERQALLETLEREHRRVKSNFRELMDATLEADPTDDLDMNVDCSKAKNVEDHTNSDFNISDELNSSAIDITMHTMDPEANNLKADNLTLPFQRRRTRSVPSYVTDNVANSVEDAKRETEELRQQLTQAQELLVSLRGTNSYMQKILQRNSELELRCTQLEAGHDETVRELHEELSRARRERGGVEASIARQSRELEESKGQLTKLHLELRDLHEKQRHHRVTASDLKDARDTVETLRDELAAAKENLKKATSEWKAEKDYIISELAAEKRRHSTNNDEYTSTPNLLGLRVSELEEFLAKSKEDAEEKISAIEEKNVKLQTSVREFTLQLDASSRTIKEYREQLNILESEATALRQSEAVARRDAAAARVLSAGAADRLLELEELRSRLDAAQTQVQSQALQIATHLNTIKDSNSRFSELAERNTVLDRLLHNQQKEKEKTIADNMRTHVQLYDQSSVYRQKLESAYRDISVLKKQLAESDEITRTSVQAVEVSKTKEIRILKEQHAANKRSLTKDYDLEISKMRDAHENELAESRQQREEKVEAVAAQYEEYLADLKAVQEKKILYLQEAKDEAINKLREDYNTRTAELHATMKERLAKQRALHEDELSNMSSTNQRNLQTHLKNKSEEIETLNRKLEKLKLDTEQDAIVASQRIEELQLQVEKAKQREALDTKDTTTTQLAEKNRELLELLQTNQEHHNEATKTLKENQKQEVATIERRLVLLQSQHLGLEQELEHIRGRLAVKQEEETKLRESYQEQLVLVESEKARVVTETLNEKDKIKEELNVITAQLTRLHNNTATAEEIENLKAALDTATTTATQLQERMDQETSLLKSQLAAKEERLQSWLTTSQHITAIVSRNSELEQTNAETSRQHSKILQEKLENIASLETTVSRLKKSLDDQLAENENLKTDVARTQTAIARAEQQLEDEKDRAKDAEIQQKKVLELIEKVETLQSQLALTETKCTTDPDAFRRRLESMKQLAEELTSAKEENRKLHNEISDLRSDAEQSSRLSLEVVLLNQRIESQQQNIDSLRDRVTKKQEVIDELATQLMSQDKVDDETIRPNDSLEKKFQELTKRYQDLIDEKLNYEQERRAAHHRVELERQLLSQCIDQKDRQMRQLLETNRRAEQLFARNAELEELLSRTQADLDSVRYRVNENGLPITGHSGQCSQHVSPIRQSASQVYDSETTKNEFDSLKTTINEKDRRIHALTNELRDFKIIHAKEIEALNTRLRFVSLEQSLAPLSDEDDLLKLLVEKTTELQKEVLRLQRERDVDEVTSDVLNLEEQIQFLITQSERLEQDQLQQQTTSNSNTESQKIFTDQMIQFQQAINHVNVTVQTQYTTLQKLYRQTQQESYNARYSLDGNNIVLKDLDCLKQLIRKIETYQQTLNHLLELACNEEISSVSKFSNIDIQPSTEQLPLPEASLPVDIITNSNDEANLQGTPKSQPVQSRFSESFFLTAISSRRKNYTSHSSCADTSEALEQTEQSTMCALNTQAETFGSSGESTPSTTIGSSSIMSPVSEFCTAAAAQKMTEAMQRTSTPTPSFLQRSHRKSLIDTQFITAAEKKYLDSNNTSNAASNTVIHRSKRPRVSLGTSSYLKSVKNESCTSEDLSSQIDSSVNEKQ